MGVKEIADRYIGRDGGAPAERMEPMEHDPTTTQTATITLTLDEYKMLLFAAQAADEIAWCARCKAWLNKEEPAYCCEPEDGIDGCWKFITGEGLCVSHRAID